MWTTWGMGEESWSLTAVALVLPSLNVSSREEAESLSVACTTALQVLELTEQRNEEGGDV